MKIPHLRWYVAALLFLATVINYVDRQALSVVAPVLTKELELTPVAYANVLQAFLWAYTVMYVISGIIVDKWGNTSGSRRIYGVAVCGEHAPRLRDQRFPTRCLPLSSWSR